MRLSQRRQNEVNYWPGFVDAMATLLLVIVFLLSIFILSQVFLGRQISSKDNILQQLRGQISELTESLALEKENTEDIEARLALLRATLDTSEQQNAALRATLDASDTDEKDAAYLAQISALEDKIGQEEELSEEALSQVQILNQQLAALRQQLSVIEAALETSKAKERDSQEQIASLGQKLNAALVARVQQLSDFRSDFFGQLRQILSGRDDVKIVGDRFVFQSELLFGAGQATISEQGRVELGKLSSVILDIGSKIPEDINWVVRVDGHTDNRPINTVQFPSNWELSAARAIAVARTMSEFGVPPQRLVAAGFGEFQPIDDGDSPKALARNRRIEFKLTER